MTITGVSLRMPIISTMKSLFLLNSLSVILADPSNKKRLPQTYLFVLGEKSMKIFSLEDGNRHKYTSNSPTRFSGLMKQRFIYKHEHYLIKKCNNYDLTVVLSHCF